MLGNIDRQWGLGAGWWGMFGIGDSPLTSGEESAVLRPREAHWFHNGGNSADLSVLEMLCNVCVCGFLVGMLARLGKGWID